jgi:hypothetical protein
VLGRPISSTILKDQDTYMRISTAAMRLPQLYPNATEMGVHVSARWSLETAPRFEVMGVHGSSGLDLPRVRPVVRLHRMTGNFVGTIQASSFPRNGIWSQ